MRVAVTCDHGGFPLRQAVIDTVEALGHEVLDLGIDHIERVDYVDYAVKAGHALQEGQADRAIGLCGSGVGMCIAGNKMSGVYACVCHDTYSAHQAVEHDNMNMLCLGGRIIGDELARELVKAFLSTEFSTVERYRTRHEKVRDLETNFGR
ncbi:MAG TPA: RpiB/LacA/LacB family sugar-phosphate isomerase [Longilinea sp.]|nr:RpiB/LacA/LacB family sugar-phosphate isomerase [Longilinea sp.]